MKTSEYNLIKKENNNFKIFNVYSGAQINVTEDFYKKLQNKDQNKYSDLFDKDTYSSLVKLGFIVPNTNEFDDVKNKISDKFFSNESLELTLIVTKQCNFRCTYCYEEHIDDEFTEELFVSVAKLIKYKIEKEGLLSLEINLFGGEPLLKYSQIVSFLKIVNSYKEINSEFKITGSITTNAYLLTIDKVIELQKLGISNYQITIDGLEDSHNNLRPHVSGRNTWSKIIYNIDQIYQLVEPVNVVIRTNINQEVLSNYKDFLEYIKERYNNKFLIQYEFIKLFNERVSSNIINEKHYPEIDRLLKDDINSLGLNSSENLSLGCFACKRSFPNSFCVLPNGNLTKCTVYYEDPLACVGRLNLDGKVEFNSNLQLWEQSEHTNCKSCKVYPLCLNYICPIQKIKDKDTVTNNNSEIIQKQLLERF